MIHNPKAYSLTLQDLSQLLDQEGLLKESCFGPQESQRLYTYLSCNSTDVRENTFFICKGLTFKEQYLLDAIQKGAGAYLAQEAYPQAAVPHILVKDIRKAMALCANYFYGQAQEALTLLGITGTKGKTTTAYFLDDIFRRALGRRCGLLSTVEIYTGRESHESHLTTPESPDLYKYFAQCREEKLPTLTMEVSSLAYKWDRVYGLDFDLGLFLNLGSDHVSPGEHESFEDYRDCKLALMRHCRQAIVNLDDPWGERFAEEARQQGAKVLTYGSDPTCDLWVSDLEKWRSGSAFVVHDKKGAVPFRLALAGRFNVSNALAAIAAARVLGISDEVIAQSLETIQVSGRMKVIEKDGITVVVDFAHNEMSLRSLYESLKKEYPGQRLVVVGGSVGGKNQHRRGEIGRLAGEYADAIYLTADDPQYEDVTAICQEIANYIEPFGKPVQIIPDRAQAVQQALADARPGDVVVLQSKGEETFLKIRGRFEPYEGDLVLAKRALHFPE